MNTSLQKKKKRKISLPLSLLLSNETKVTVLTFSALPL